MALVSIFLFLIFLLVLLGLWIARRTATVVQVDVPINGLPAVLEGFSIAHITGLTSQSRYLQRMVNSVNNLNADMVAIVGSLLHSKGQELQTHAAPIAKLRSTHGTFFVTDRPEWAQALEKLGVQVLRNEHAVIHHNTDSQDPERAVVVVAGVLDKHSNPHSTMTDAPTLTLLRVLLTQQTRRTPHATLPGFDLQLSGHGHWLQRSKITHLRLVRAP
jgi:uncharacterized protein